MILNVNVFVLSVRGGEYRQEMILNFTVFCECLVVGNIERN